MLAWQLVEIKTFKFLFIIISSNSCFFMVLVLVKGKTVKVTFKNINLLFWPI